MNSSSALSWTRIRDRAQQSCPALSNTAYGAVAAALATSASANTMLALLPPSSRVHRFTWSAQPRMIDLPTSVEPVKQTLRTSGWVTNRSPDHCAPPRQHGEHALGQPCLAAQLPQPERGERGEFGRLQHDRVARGQRRREAPAGDRHREVPRHDHPDHPERLAEGDVHPARHRDLPAEQALRGRGVVVEHVAYVACLPARVGDGVPRVAHLQLRELLQVGVDQSREPAQQPGPHPGGDVAPRRKGRVRRLDRHVGAVPVGEFDPRHRPLGGGVDHGARRRRSSAHIRSNPRRSSQSVTAASKAASSTSARFV